MNIRHRQQRALHRHFASVTGGRGRRQPNSCSTCRTGLTTRSISCPSGTDRESDFTSRVPAAAPTYGSPLPSPPTRCGTPTPSAISGPVFLCPGCRCQRQRRIHFRPRRGPRLCAGVLHREWRDENPAHRAGPAIDQRPRASRCPVICRGRIGIRGEEELDGGQAQATDGPDPPIATAVYNFRNAPPPQIVNGQIPFELANLQIQRGGEAERIAGGPTRLSITLRTFPPADRRPVDCAGGDSADDVFLGTGRRRHRRRFDILHSMPQPGPHRRLLSRFAAMVTGTPELRLQPGQEPGHPVADEPPGDRRGHLLQHVSLLAGGDGPDGHPAAGALGREPVGRRQRRRGWARRSSTIFNSALRRRLSPRWSAVPWTR